MLIRSVAEIKRMYLERSDSLDASSYEVLDLCEEIERLRAVVDKLSKTADGVYVIPCRTHVYHPSERGHDGRPCPLMIDWNDWASRGPGTGGNTYRVSECFSTPEAAEAGRVK